MKIKLPLLLIFVLLICLKCCYSNREKEEIQITDTITIIKRDTITIIKPQPIVEYRDRIIRDTLYSIDSIPVFINVPLKLKYMLIVIIGLLLVVIRLRLILYLFLIKI